MKKLFYIVLALAAITATAQLQPHKAAHDDFLRASQHAESRSWDSVGFYLDRCHQWQLMQQPFLASHDDSVAYSFMLDSLSDYYGIKADVSRIIETAKTGTAFDSILFGTNSPQYVRHSNLLSIAQTIYINPDTSRLKDILCIAIRRFEAIGDTLSREYEEYKNSYESYDKPSAPLQFLDSYNWAIRLDSLAESLVVAGETNEAITLEVQAIDTLKTILDKVRLDNDEESTILISTLIDEYTVSLSTFLMQPDQITDYSVICNMLLPIAKRWKGNNYISVVSKLMLLLAYHSQGNLLEAQKWIEDEDVTHALNDPHNKVLNSTFTSDTFKAQFYDICAKVSTTKGRTDDAIAYKKSALYYAQKADYPLYYMASLELDIADLFFSHALNGLDVGDSIVNHINRFDALNVAIGQTAIAQAMAGDTAAYFSELNHLGILGAARIRLCFQADPSYPIDSLINNCDVLINNYCNLNNNDTTTFFHLAENLLLMKAQLHARKAIGLQSQTIQKFSNNEQSEDSLSDLLVGECSLAMLSLQNAQQFVNHFAQNNKELYSIYILHNILAIETWMGWVTPFFESLHDHSGSKTQRFNNYLLPQLLAARADQREITWKTYADVYSSILPRICQNLNSIDSTYYIDDDFQKYSKPDSTNCDTYDATLFRKGLLLKIGQEMERAIEESNNPLLINAMHRRNELDRSASHDKNEQKQRDLLEQELIDMATKDTTLLKQFDVHWQDVRRALGNNDVAIEFLHYPILNGDNTVMTTAALKLRKEYDVPKFIHLSGIEGWLYSNIEDDKWQDQLWYDTGLIDQWIWVRLLGEEISEGGKYRVFFAADGPLHNIAIENSPAMAHSENFELHRVASTRELVDGQRPLKLTDAVLFGNIAYDAPGDSVLAANRDLRQPQPSESSILSNEIFASINDMKTRGGRGSIYDYLSDTKAEIAHVEAALNSVGTACRTYDQARASEEAFKSLDGHSPTIIHLATHGYYVPPEKVESEREDMKLPFLEIGLGRSTAEDVALTHSFLTMAGSRDMKEYNQRDGVTHLEDGHLTAHEISRMDLHDTRLVVLSACESALGEVTNDGVLGLQRGFKRAGAGTIVMTVRKVGDAPAKDFMITFYDELAKQLKQKPNDPNVLRNAFTAARDHVRDKYRNNPDCSLDWAYFIMLD